VSEYSPVVMAFGFNACVITIIKDCHLDVSDLPNMYMYASGLCNTDKV